MEEEEGEREEEERKRVGKRKQGWGPRAQWQEWWFQVSRMFQLSFRIRVQEAKGLTARSCPRRTGRPAAP